MSGDFPRPPTVPYRKRSAYQNFVSANSANVKLFLIEQTGSSKLERGLVQKETAARWKAMSDEEKAVWSSES